MYAIENSIFGRKPIFAVVLSCVCVYVEVLRFAIAIWALQEVECKNKFFRLYEAWNNVDTQSRSQDLVLNKEMIFTSSFWTFRTLASEKAIADAILALI
jgi:hypothetical protein